RIVVLQQRLCRPEQRFHADVEHRAEPFGLDLLDGAIVQDHRIVHDSVDSTGLGREIGRDVEIGLPRADIAFVRARRAAAALDLAGDLPRVRAVDVDDRDARAETCEMGREVRAETAAGAGDQDVFVVESVGHRTVRSVVEWRSARVPWRRLRADLAMHTDYSRTHPLAAPVRATPRANLERDRR